MAFMRDKPAGEKIESTLFEFKLLAYEKSNYPLTEFTFIVFEVFKEYKAKSG